MAVPTFMSRGAHMTFEQQSSGWREKRAIVTRNLNSMNLNEKQYKSQEAEYVEMFFLIFSKFLFSSPDPQFS